MGVLDKFRRKATTPPPAAGSVGAGSFWDGDPLVPLSGTVTTGQVALTDLMDRRSLPQRTTIEDTATLQREPDNPVDPAAVAVLLDGERIGYLPGWVAAAFTLTVGAACLAPVQLFTAPQDGHVRCEGWLWLGDEPVRWRHGAENRPPVTREEKRAADHDRSRKMVADALASGGTRAAEFRTGMVNGVHYLELVEPIKQLKRDGRLEEALELCYAAIAGAEKDRGGSEPAPFYTEQAAIVLHKLGRREEEAAVLRRYLKHVPSARRDTSKFTARLAKLQ